MQCLDANRAGDFQGEVRYALVTSAAGYGAMAGLTATVDGKNGGASVNRGGVG